MATKRGEMIEAIAFELAEFHREYGDRAQAFSREQVFMQVKRRVGNPHAATTICTTRFVNDVEKRMRYWTRALEMEATA